MGGLFYLNLLSGVPDTTVNMVLFDESTVGSISRYIKVKTKF
jgi:hypothetical protein